MYQMRISPILFSFDCSSNASNNNNDKYEAVFMRYGVPCA